VTRQFGVTLIELMIVVVIIGLLAVVATPFTAAWVHEAQVNDARSQLHRAHAQAKSVALRNPRDARGNDLAACVVIGGDTVEVREPTAGNCTGTKVWEGAWPDVQLTLGNGSDEIHINNRGQVLIGGSPSHAGLTYTLEKGSVTYDSDEDDNPLK